MSDDRLSRKIRENKKLIDIREQKIFEINKALAIETNPERRFSYSQLISIEKEYIASLQSEIDGWESELKRRQETTELPTDLSNYGQGTDLRNDFTTPKLKVYFCYSPDDKLIARELCSQLRTAVWMNIWVNELELLGGQNRDLEIEKAVRKANVVIICVSKNWTTKQANIHRELRLALDAALNIPEDEIFIIPLRLENCELPFRLRNLYPVDYFESNRTEAYKQLLASLKSRANSLGIPTFENFEQK
jgi:hypothetical protein